MFSEFVKKPSEVLSIFSGLFRDFVNSLNMFMFSVTAEVHVKASRFGVGGGVELAI